MSRGRRNRRNRRNLGPSRGRGQRRNLGPLRRPTTSPASPVRPRLTPPVSNPVHGPFAPTPYNPSPMRQGLRLPASHPHYAIGNRPTTSPRVPSTRGPVHGPRVPSRYTQFIHGSGPSRLAAAGRFASKATPLYLGLMAVEGAQRFGSGEQAQMRREQDLSRWAARDYGNAQYDPDTGELVKPSTALGTVLGGAGRALEAQLDPVGTLSAFGQTMGQVGEQIFTDKGKGYDPMAHGEKGLIGDEQIQAGEKLRDYRQRRVAKLFEGVEGVGKQFLPSAFVAEGMGSERAFLEGRAGDPEFSEAEKRRVMEIEKLSAERAGRDPLSYEEVMKRRQGATSSKAGKFFDAEDRKEFARLAKEEPQTLMAMFDADKDGELSNRERKAIFDPQIGFKARRQAVLAQEEAAKEAEAQAARSYGVDATRDALSMFPMQAAAALDKRKARKEKRAARAEKKAQEKSEKKAAKAEQLKKDRIAFAKGLESDLGYDDSPSSAFQNPETRQRIMVEAFKRGEELGVSKPQVRMFLRNKGLLDKGFSESYADFHKRTTSGGGLTTGSVGARRTVGRGPKTETGGVPTQDGRAADAARKAYMEDLMRRRMLPYQDGPAITRDFKQTNIPSTILK